LLRIVQPLERLEDRLGELLFEADAVVGDGEPRLAGAGASGAYVDRWAAPGS
jgi:hypothetical protein